MLGPPGGLASSWLPVYTCPMYDWGNRQGRVDRVLARLKKLDPSTEMSVGEDITVAEIIDHIENGTDKGKEVVAVYGVVSEALESPDSV